MIPKGNPENYTSLTDATEYSGCYRRKNTANV
jgi:hypothetical protein